MAPLTDLTKIDHSFEWTDAYESAFNGIKQDLTNAPLLRMPVFNKSFEIVSDTSDTAIGVVLLQDKHPIAFESRKLSKVELNSTVTEKELLGVMHALRVWQCYLEGLDMVLLIDHCPNTYLDNQQTLGRRQARWSEFL